MSGTYFKDNFLKFLPRLYATADKEEDLREILEIMASEFDSAMDLVDQFVKLFDVQNVPANYLPYLAKLLDYAYDPTGDAEVQRVEIKNLIPVYRRRGTKPGILRKLRLAGYEAEIFEPYTKTIKVNAVGRGLGTSCKLAGAMYSHGTFRVRLLGICRALWDILGDEVPRGVRMFATMVDANESEMGVELDHTFVSTGPFDVEMQLGPFSIETELMEMEA